MNGCTHDSNLDAVGLQQGNACLIDGVADQHRFDVNNHVVEFVMCVCVSERVCVGCVGGVFCVFAKCGRN